MQSRNFFDSFGRVTLIASFRSLNSLLNLLFNLKCVGAAGIKLVTKYQLVIKIAFEVNIC